MRKYFLLTIFFALFLGCLFVPKAHAVVEISDGSVNSLFHLENNFDDSSTNAYNGTNGTNAMNFVTGKIGTYGANSSSSGAGADYWTAPSSALNHSGDFTFVGWYRINGDASNNDLFFFQGWQGGDNTQNLGFSYGYLCAAGNIEFHEGGSCVINAAYTFTQGNWYWMVAERASNVLTIYINNTFFASSTDSSVSASTHDMYFNNDEAGDNGNQVTEDEIAWINKAISSDQRTALYNGGAGDSICITTGCGGATPAPTSTPASTSTIQNNKVWSLPQMFIVLGQGLAFASGLIIIVLLILWLLKWPFTFR